MFGLKVVVRVHANLHTASKSFSRDRTIHRQVVTRLGVEARIAYLEGAAYTGAPIDPMLLLTTQTERCHREFSSCPSVTLPPFIQAHSGHVSGLILNSHSKQTGLSSKYRESTSPLRRGPRTAGLTKTPQARKMSRCSSPKFTLVGVRFLS